MVDVGGAGRFRRDEDASVKRDDESIAHEYKFGVPPLVRLIGEAQYAIALELHDAGRPHHSDHFPLRHPGHELFGVVRTSAPPSEYQHANRNEVLPHRLFAPITDFVPPMRSSEDGGHALVNMNY
jgi:hypothetical protein